MDYAYALITVGLAVGIVFAVRKYLFSFIDAPTSAPTTSRLFQGYSSRKKENVRPKCYESSNSKSMTGVSFPIADGDAAACAGGCQAYFNETNALVTSFTVNENECVCNTPYACPGRYQTAQVCYAFEEGASTFLADGLMTDPVACGLIRSVGVGAPVAMDSCILTAPMGVGEFPGALSGDGSLTSTLSPTKEYDLGGAKRSIIMSFGSPTPGPPAQRAPSAGGPTAHDGALLKYPYGNVLSGSATLSNCTANTATNILPKTGPTIDSLTFSGGGEVGDLIYTGGIEGNSQLSTLVQAGSDAEVIEGKREISWKCGNQSFPVVNWANLQVPSGSPTVQGTKAFSALCCDPAPNTYFSPDYGNGACDPDY